jgi:hypothetical protein
MKNAFLFSILLSGCGILNANTPNSQEKASIQAALMAISEGVAIADALCLSTLPKDRCDTFYDFARNMLLAAGDAVDAGDVQEGACAAALAVSAMQDLAKDLQSRGTNIPAAMEFAIKAKPFLDKICGD